jgi:shikimate dehydrogenase
VRRFGLIGYPLTHSFSKKFFTEKFEKEGIKDCIYELFPIKSVYEVNDLLRTYPDLAGLNVTIPYKQLILRALYSSVNTIPSGIRACNCIRIENGKMIGYNTDIVGFEKSLAGKLQPHHTKALILGNGGATEAVGYVLRKLKISYDIVSRQLHDGSTLTYKDLNQKLISTSTLIINTTPVGTYPDVHAFPDIPYEFITPDHYLFDLVYNPSRTLFLEKGEQRGATIKNGYDMLVIQAEESWKIWNQ